MVLKLGHVELGMTEHLQNFKSFQEAVGERVLSFISFVFWALKRWVKEMMLAMDVKPGAQKTPEENIVWEPASSTGQIQDME